MKFSELDSEQLTLLYKEVKKAARYMSYRWPKTTTPDDIQQMILEFLMEERNVAALRMALSRSETERWTALRKVANQCAARERNDYDQFSCNYYYSVGEVWTYLRNDALIGGLPNGFTEVRMDIENGLNYMRARKSPYVDVLVDYYVHGKRVDQAAKQRAVTSLTDAMNKSHREKELVHYFGDEEVNA